MTIVEFLRARMGEDERAAKAWLPFGNPDAAAREHIARHDPARVLREVGAKRRILDAHADAVRMHRLMDETDDDGKWDWLFKSEALQGVLQLLALPHSDHPDYDPAWRA